MSTNPIGIFHQFHYVVLPFQFILQSTILAYLKNAFY
nr:MAG TPA: hypothetical protein [Caudoviricetes sp.]